MTAVINFDEKLLFNKLNFENQDEVLRFLAKNLNELGYVNNDYIEAIIEREGMYPTGIPSDVPALAIPHTNNDLVNKTTISVATLDTPIKFRNMEEPNKFVDAEIIIMLAIAEPKGQIEMLQKVVALIQNHEARVKLVQAENSQQMIEVLDEIIN